MTAAADHQGCSLCQEAGGMLIWANPRFRVVAAAEPNYPGFVRIISQSHAKELTDLKPNDRIELFEILVCIEEQMRLYLSPLKVNIASLGNMVAHLHWHIVPRFAEDPCFPDSVWSTPRREPNAERLKMQEQKACEFFQALGQQLSRQF